jgi:hypothetical protein
VFNLETNTVVEPYDVTFDETAPCPCDVFECACDKEMEESIFINEGLQDIDSDKDEPLLPSTSSPESVPASTLETEAPQATTTSTATVEACSDEGCGRSRRPDAEDQGWSHRSGTRWPGGREVGWRRVRSAPCTWRRGARASWLILKTKVDSL